MVMTTHASYSGNSYIAEERQYKYKSLQKENLFNSTKYTHLFVPSIMLYTSAAY